MPALPFIADRAGIRIAVRLTPRGGRDAIDGIDRLADGEVVLKARVAAAPEDGRANAALAALIAKALHVPKSAVAIVAGKQARRKIVSVEGDAARLAAALEALTAKRVRAGDG
jgi:uncharacterized protein YggU (UPF0235/DUF167 family)